VSDADRGLIDVRELLDVVAAASPVEAVDVMVDELGTRLGAEDVCFLIIDLGGRAVARFGGSAANAARAREQGALHVPMVNLANTPYGQVWRSQQPLLATAGDRVELIVPVTDRGDAIGLLELGLAWRPTHHEVAEIAGIGRALAQVLIACRRHTDLFEWAQRSTLFSLAAEIQRRLLPDAYTCEAGQFTVAGWLEPANAVGGDTFDYALERDTLHVSITDAVGHDVNAATLATVLVGSLRNGRRHDMDLLRQARFANEALIQHSRVGEFVTGQLARVELSSGVMTIVNAGHPPPYRVRDGQVEQIELEVDMPFGVQPDHDFHMQRILLEPGDRIMFITDGIIERDAEDLDVPALLVDTAQRHPREAVYTLGEAVLRANGGNLRDDATGVCLDWRGGPHRAPDDDGVHRQPGLVDPTRAT
jgi:serine phosphatase RsbU (regulator of sigma subunit)